MMLILNICYVSQERHSAKTVGEIKQFVSKLPHMQAARTSLATREFWLDKVYNCFLASIVWFITDQAYFTTV